MKPIRTTAVYGLGALGMLFGSGLQKTYGPENIKFVMDSPRYARHKRDLYAINDETFVFSLQDASDVSSPSDLVIVAVKGPDLKAVVNQIAPSVGPDTIIISLMNGITSEEKKKKNTAEAVFLTVSPSVWTPCAKTRSSITQNAAKYSLAPAMVPRRKKLPLWKST